MKDLAILFFPNHCVKSAQIQSFFWPVFSCIRTEYGDLNCKSPYSIRIQKNTDQKKLHIWKLLTQWILYRENFVLQIICQNLSKCRMLWLSVSLKKNIQIRRYSPARSSHQRCSIRKAVFRNFAKFTENICQSLFFNKVAVLGLTTLLKKRLWHRCFPVDFAKFLRTPFL